MKLKDRNTMTVAQLITALQKAPPDYEVWGRIKSPMRGRVGAKVGGGADGPIKRISISHEERCTDLLGVEE